MCKCTPEIRTPFCGKVGCEWDNVNHPPHYNSSKAECPGCERRIECIDITRHMNFNIGNAFKYLWRAEHKGGIEDLKKAIWYLQNEIDKNEKS